MKTKAFVMRTLSVGLLALCAVSAYGLSEDEKTRLETLRGMSLEDLQEVELRLDDAFDVFDGIVKQQSVSVATGVKQDKARAPSVTSLITAQDIEAMGAETLDDVLAAVPGLHAGVNPNGKRYMPLYMIRGIGNDVGPEVLMLINGISINTVGAGGREVWGAIPVHAIARVEVIRGPGSAVYGADAFSGVINIITKTKTDINGTEAGIRAGSFDTENAWLLHGGIWAGFDIAASVQYRDTNGQREMIQADAQSIQDRLNNTHASHAPGTIDLQRRGLDLHLDLSRGNWQGRVQYQSHNHIGSGTGIGLALDPEGFWYQKVLLTDLTYHNPFVGNFWDVTATLSYYNQSWGPDTDVRRFPRNAVIGKTTYPNGMISNPGAAEENSRLEIAGIYSGFARHLIRIGAGYHKGDIYEVLGSRNYGIGPDGKPLSPENPPVSIAHTPYTFLPEGGRSDYAFSLQDTWQFASSWELTAGVRYDEYSDFGSTVNPRGALVWQMSPDLTGKLMYGRAFRAPSYTEQFSRNNLSKQGNPELKPEIIQSLELAFDYRMREDLNFAMNLFGYDIKDKIIFAPNLANTGSADPRNQVLLAQNIGAQKGYGLEWEARWKINTRASLLFNYSYAKATDENQDTKMPFVPQHMAYLRADWLLMPNWYLDAQAKWISSRERELRDIRPAVDDYTTVNLTLRYKDIRKGGWNFALGVRNLFDTEAFEPSSGPDTTGVIAIPYDLPLAGRSWWAEARYTFK